MTFSWKETPRPIVALAPMDGYTDSAFRQLVKRIEPRAICYTEFLSSDFFFYKPKEAVHLLNAQPQEYPLIVQLFGKNPEHFAVAAKLAEENGAAGVDINMGCPAKKVVNSQHGAYMMQNCPLAAEVIRTVKKAVNIPVSVKTRIGWEDDSNLINFVKQLIDAGIDHVAIHGRTYQQHFKGFANWEPIYKLKEAVPITVIGNGDITSWQTAKEKLGNLDGVMVDRATFGNPWLMKEIAMYLYEGKEWDSHTVTLEEKLDTMLLHAELLIQTKGEHRAMLECRKHMAMYVSGMPGAAEFRNRLVRVQSLQEVETIIAEIRAVPVPPQIAPATL